MAVFGMLNFREFRIEELLSRQFLPGETSCGWVFYKVAKARNIRMVQSAI